MKPSRRKTSLLAVVEIAVAAVALAAVVVAVTAVAVAVAAIAVATTTDINRISDTKVKDRREPVFLIYIWT
jgi:hypothetical protein